jgi:hypothetical protein
MPSERGEIAAANWLSWRTWNWFGLKLDFLGELGGSSLRLKSLPFSEARRLQRQGRQEKAGKVAKGRKSVKLGHYNSGHLDDACVVCYSFSPSY